MTTYRVLTNGQQFRVQYRSVWWPFWRTDGVHYYHGFIPNEFVDPVTAYQRIDALIAEKQVTPEPSWRPVGKEVIG